MAAPQSRQEFVQFYRQQNPASTIADDEIVAQYAREAQERGVIDQFPELQSALGAPPERQGLGSEFWNAVKSGTDQGQAKLYGTAELAGGLTGIDSLEKWGEEGRHRNEDEARAEYSPAVASFEQIKDPNDFAYWLAGVVGAQAPQILGTVGAGVTAAALAPAEGAAAGAVGVAALGARLAPYLGEIVTGVVGFTQGQNYGELKDAGGENAVPLSIANGLIGSVLENIGLPAGVKGYMNKSALTKVAKTVLDQTPAPIMRVALMAAKEGSKEMLTEVAQEAATIGSEMVSQRDNPEFQISDEQIRSRLLNAGVSAFAAGSLFNTAINKVLEAPKPKKDAPPYAAPGENLVADLANSRAASLDIELPPPPVRPPVDATAPAPSAAAAAPVAATRATNAPILADLPTQQRLVDLGIPVEQAATIPAVEAQQLLDQAATQQRAAAAAQEAARVRAEQQAALQAQQAAAEQAAQEQLRIQNEAQQARIAAVQRARQQANEHRQLQAELRKTPTTPDESYITAGKRVKKGAAQTAEVLNQTNPARAPVSPNTMAKPTVENPAAVVPTVASAAAIPQISTPETPAAQAPAAPAAAAPVPTITPTVVDETKPPAPAPMRTGLETLIGAKLRSSPDELITARETVTDARRGSLVERDTHNVAVIVTAGNQVKFVPVFNSRKGEVRALLGEKRTKKQIVDQINAMIGQGGESTALTTVPLSKPIAVSTLDAIVSGKLVSSKPKTAERNAWLIEQAQRLGYGRKAAPDVSLDELVSHEKAQVIGYMQFQEKVAPGIFEWKGSMEALQKQVGEMLDKAGSKFNEGFGLKSQKPTFVSLEGSTEANQGGLPVAADPVVGSAENKSTPESQAMRLPNSTVRRIAQDLELIDIDEALSRKGLQWRRFIEGFDGYIHGDNPAATSRARRVWNELDTATKTRLAREALFEARAHRETQGASEVVSRKNSPDDHRLSESDAPAVLSDLAREAAARGIDLVITDANGKSAVKWLQDEGGATPVDASNRTVALVMKNVLAPTQQDVIAALHEILHDQVKTLPEDIRLALHDMIARIPLGERAYFKNPSADPRVRDGNNPANLSSKQLTEEQLVEHLALKGLEKPVAQGLVSSLFRAAKEMFYRGALHAQRLFMGEENTGGRLARAYGDLLVERILGGDTRRINGFLEQFGAKPTYARIARLVTEGKAVRVERMNPATGEVSLPFSHEFSPEAARYNVESPIDAAKQAIFSGGLLDKAEAERLLGEALGEGAQLRQNATDEIARRAEEARVETIRRAHVEAAVANQFGKLWASLHERLRQADPSYTYDQFVEDHKGIDPVAQREMVMERATERLKSELGADVQLPLNPEILIDQLQNNERGLGEYKLHGAVVSVESKLTAALETNRQREIRLSERAEKDRAVVAEIDKNLGDVKATDRMSRDYIREDLNQLKRDLKRLDRVGHALGGADAILEQLTDETDRQALAAKYEDKLIDQIDVESLGFMSAMKALFRMEATHDIDLSTASPREIQDAVKMVVAADSSSALAPLVSIGEGPQGRVRGTALLAAIVSFVKNRAHISDVIRLQLENTAQSREALVRLREVLRETNEARIAEIRKSLGDTKRPGDRAIANFMKRRDRARAELKELERLQKQNANLPVSLSALATLRERLESRRGVTHGFSLAPGSKIPDPRTPDEPNATAAVGGTTLSLGRDHFSKHDELIQIYRRQKAWLDYRADKPELQDIVYHDIKAASERILLATGGDKANKTLSGIHSGIHDNIGEFWKRTGTRAGAIIQRMWVKFSEIPRALAAESTAGGKRWEVAAENFYKEIGLRPEDAIERFYNPGADFLGSKPHMVEEEAFVALRRMMESTSGTSELLARNPAAWPAFETFMKESRQENQRQMRNNLKYGVRVADDKLKTGPANVYRMPLERGVTGYTFSRVIRNSVASLIISMDSRLRWLGDGQNNPFVDTGLKLRTNEADLKAQLAEFATTDIKNKFLVPLILSERSRSLPAPVREDGVRNTVPVEIAAHAWTESKGDLVEFFRSVYRSMGSAGDTESQHVYVETGLKWVHDKFKKVNSLVNEKSGQIGLGAAHVAMDSRVADDLPPEFLQYEQFGIADNFARDRLLAAHVAFGRDLSDLESMHAQAIQELNVLAAELGGTAAEREHNKRLHAKEKGWFELREAAADMYRKAQEMSSKVTTGILHPENGAMADAGVAMEVYGLMLTGLVAGPKSAIKNLLSPLDAMALEKSAGLKGLQTVGRSYGAAIKYTAAALTKVFGIDLLRNDRLAGLQQRVGGFDRSMTLKQGMTGARGRNNSFESSSWGRVQRIVHMLRTVVTDARIGVQGAGPALRLNLFQVTQLISNYSITDAYLKRFDEISRLTGEFYKKNPERMGTQVTAKEIGYGDNVSYEALREEAQLTGLSLELLGEKAAKTAPGKEIFEDHDVQAIMHMVAERIAGESSATTRPSYFLTSRFARASSALTGWSFFKTAQVARVLREPGGARTMSTVLHGLKVMGLGLVPAAVAFSLMLDEYDEEITGKRSNLKPLSMDHLWASVLERSVAMGTFGIAGDVVDTMNNVKDGTGQRLLSVDGRVVWLNSILGMAKATADLQAMGGFENANYANFWRRVAQAGGLGGLLQYVQIGNKLLDRPDLRLFSDEAGVTARINASNLLRAYGRELGMEVRNAGGSATPTPMTPWVTNMQLAALTNDREGFLKAYKGAIKAAQEMGKPDPLKAIAESYGTRHPLKSVFRLTPSVAEYQQLLGKMDATSRSAVSQAVNLFNQYGMQINTTPFVGSQGVKSTVLAQARPRSGLSVTELRSMLAARRSEEQ